MSMRIKTECAGRRPRASLGLAWQPCLCWSPSGHDGRNSMSQIFRGGCLCGAVRYEARGPLREVTVCHCGQCRKWHGASPGYTAANRDGFRLTSDKELAWYESSAFAKRGFCRKCGSSLFWQGNDRPHISIAAGTLDGPTHLKTTKHIYVADKGDYYDIADGLPQHARSN
jgi:hypothetical protein